MRSATKRPIRNALSWLHGLYWIRDIRNDFKRGGYSAGFSGIAFLSILIFLVATMLFLLIALIWAVVSNIVLSEFLMWSGIVFAILGVLALIGYVVFFKELKD